MNKILIIDDDRELCALIKRSVQAENIEADFCNTGKEGLQKLREQEYQLVVLDVMMPGMDGFETLEEIRKENSLPILMFTSKNDSISKVRGLRAGADDYLTKPFDMDELIARIASLIRRYTRFNQSAQFSVIIYNQNFIHGAVPFLVLSDHQSASPQFLGEAKHQPFSQRRGYALRRNNNLPYEVLRPISRRPLSMSYSPFRTSIGYIIVLFLEQCKKRNMNYKLQLTCI